MRNIISNIKLVYNNKVGLFIAIFKTKLNSIRQLWIKLENSNYLNIKLLTFIIFLYLLSFCVHCESIIMLFNFDYQTALTIYITIIGATTGILGITITVLVIAVQFLTEKYDEFASDALLSNKKLRDIITCYVLAIILPLLTIIFLNQNHALQSSDYFRIVFCVLLFSFVTIKLFAQLPKIVKSTNTIKILKNLDEKINKETLYEFIHLHKKSTLLLLEHKEKNIINTISKIGVKAIQKDDEFTLESLIEFRLHKFSKLLNDSIDNPKEFYRSNNVIETYFFYFIKPLLDRALDNKNGSILKSVYKENQKYHFRDRLKSLFFCLN